MTDLRELAERVEALEGPSREVDADVFKAIGAPCPFQFMNKLIALEYNDVEQAYFARVSDDMRVRYAPPAYTADLNAAMSLVPEGWETAIYLGGPNTNVQMETEEMRQTCIDFYPIEATAATPALALVAAALRAIASEQEKG